MAADTKGLVPIFATPFASLQLEVADGLNAELLRLLQSRATPRYQRRSAPASAFTFIGADDLFEWTDEPVQRLRAELLSAVCAVVGALNRYSESQFDALSMQARAFFSLIKPNGFIAAATHAMYSWCAVYCVAAPERVSARFDSGGLRLYELRLQTSYLDAGNWNMHAPFQHGHHIWQPRPGWLAVFPAFHPHEIAINRENELIALVTATVRFTHPAPKDAASP
ncbi:MAG TPA: hypothetical protein VMT92_10545 [Steroidobacteraceae bacterium]|nr:hypothetical protein [Steroidobacteraceae bacterium]